MFIESAECPNAKFSGRRFLVQPEETVRAILATSATYPHKSVIEVDAAVDLPPDAQRKRTVEVVSQAASALSDSFDAVRSGQLQINRLSPVADEISDRIDASPDIFLKVTRLKSKDEGTYVHSLAVSALMMRMARLIGHDENAVRELGVAGLLHDVGKLTVPTAILNKAARLEADERRVVRSHPDVGYRLLKKQGNVSQLILDIWRLHHETLDGSGYPLGLKADQLSQEIRLATVCDVFEALTSVRSYKRAWTNREALDWMFEGPSLRQETGHPPRQHLRLKEGTGRRDGDGRRFMRLFVCLSGKPVPA